MDDTENTLAIQDEEEKNTVSIVTCEDDITVNGIIGLNADGSTIDSDEE